MRRKGQEEREKGKDGKMDKGPYGHFFFPLPVLHSIYKNDNEV